MARDHKFPLGSKVYVGKAKIPAVVIRHGYDGSGLYSEVEYWTGEREQVHRSMLEPRP